MRGKIPKEMRAAVYRGPDDVRIETVPVPRIRSDEILVRVAACGVCPTDIKKIQFGTVSPPRIFGHETAGIVARVGARVRKIRVGQRVALHHHVPCLNCHACRHRSFAQCPQYKRTGTSAGFEPAGGGFAEFVRVMPFVFPGLVHIPKANSFCEGAMVEPVNTVLKALSRLKAFEGDHVWVVGQGPIGLLFTRLLALAGVRVVATDKFWPRLRRARELGAEWVFPADRPDLSARLRALTRGNGLDGVVIAVPSDEAVRSAQDQVRNGGQVLLFAHTRKGSPVEIDLGAVCADEKDLIGSYSSDFTMQRLSAKLIFSRKLDVRPLISHRFSLEQAADAIALAANPKPESLKVMLDFDPALRSEAGRNGFQSL